MMSDPTPTPHPPRFRWLKRLSLAGLVLVVALVGLRLVWGSVMQSRVDALVAEIQATGEPILFEDLAFPPLEDHENGAWYLRNALAKWPTIQGVYVDDNRWYSGTDYTYQDPVTDNPAYLARCQAALDLVRQAGPIDDADWGVLPARPLINVSLPHLGSTRQLARLMDDAAQRAVKTGDVDLAFDIMLLLRTNARHVQSRPIGIIDSLVANSILAINQELIEKSLPQIDPAALRGGPVREKAQQLIAVLQDDLQREGLIRGMIGERVYTFDTYRCLLDRTMTAQNLIGMGTTIEWMIDTPGLRHLVTPVLLDEQAVIARMQTESINALREDKPFALFSEIDARYHDRLVEDPILYTFASWLVPSYEATMRTYLRVKTANHLAAAAIAIKLYEADHGVRPSNLDQLVPGYLSAVPVDPFSSTGEPIRYKPEGVEPVLEEGHYFYSLTDEQRAKLALRPYPVLYSVGIDGVDNGGGTLAMTPLGGIEDNRFATDDNDEGDIWFMLDAMPEPVFKEADLKPEDGFDDLFLPEDESEGGEDDVEVDPDQGKDEE